MTAATAAGGRRRRQYFVADARRQKYEPGLTQHVKEPTRGGNILDLVLSKPGEQVEDVEITEPLGTSDHNVAKFKIPVPIDVIGPLTDEDRNVLATTKIWLKFLTSKFTTVFTDENMDNIPESRCLCRDENILKGVDVSYEAVLKKLEEMVPEKAPGDDSIHPVILRKLAQQLAKPLSMMFTRSLKSGQVPQDWRLANVTPIFNKI